MKKLKLTPFQEGVFKLVRKIPKGKAATYGGVASALGGPQAARAVGNALNRNPHILKWPCHRVVKSDGHVGGYARGVKEKIKTLRKEGVEIKNRKIVDFEKVLFRF